MATTVNDTIIHLILQICICSILAAIGTTVTDAGGILCLGQKASESNVMKKLNMQILLTKEGRGGEGRIQVEYI